MDLWSVLMLRVLLSGWWLLLLWVLLLGVLLLIGCLRIDGLRIGYVLLRRMIVIVMRGESVRVLSKDVDGSDNLISDAI